MTAQLTAQEPSAKYLVNLQPPLVRHFDLIAQAPGGVARLRELILTLAVQGKLVPQDPSDEPASELLKKIRTEKDRLIAEGKIKRDKPLAEIEDEEKPFEVPASWSWAHLSDLGTVGSSSRVHQKDWTTSGVPFYRAREIVSLSKNGNVHNELFIAEEHYKELARKGMCPEEGDIMITGVGTIGVPYVVKADDRFYFKDASVLIFKNQCRLNPEFLEMIFRTPCWIDHIHAHSMGTTVHTLTIVRADAVPIPLPPVLEQSRIVTRVAELMQLCDALEASGQLEAQQHAQLVGTLLGTLTQSETPEALNEAWQRIATHFDLLLDRPEAVDALEQTILQLAVRGLLAPQDPTDEPASVLLQKIRTEKDHLIAQGKIKRDKPLPPITDEEKPFELPQGWEWVSLGFLTSLITSGSRSWKDFYSVEGATFIRSQDIKYDRLEFDERAYVKLPIGTEGVRTQVRLHDVLITITGANVGKAAVVSQSMDEAYVSQHVALVRLYDIRLVDYLHLWLVSEGEGRKLLLMSSYGAKPGLNLQNINDLLVPLPPIAEQFRIVTRVNELRSHCADLRQRLAALQRGQKQLATALIENATS